MESLPMFIATVLHVLTISGGSMPLSAEVTGDHFMYVTVCCVHPCASAYDLFMQRSSGFLVFNEAKV